MTAIRGPRDLCTLPEVKRLLPNYKEPTDVDEKAAADAFLFDLIGSASTRGTQVAGREFLSELDPGDTTDTAGTVWPDAPIETRQIDAGTEIRGPGGGYAIDLRVGDMTSVTSVGVSTLYATGSPTALDLPTRIVQLPRPRGPYAPIRRLRVLGGTYAGEVYSVTGRWGFPIVPDDIRLATATQVAIWAGRDLANFSRFFLEAVAAGAREPRALAQEVYDAFFLYLIPTI